MNLRKLLFALSTITLVGTPVLTVAACKTGTTPPVADTKVEISGLKATQVTPTSEETIADDWAAVKPAEIKAMFSKSVLRALKSIPGVTDVAEGTDYTITVKTNADADLMNDSNLTSAVVKDRTFKVTVASNETSTKLKGTTESLSVIMESRLAKTDFSNTAVVAPTIAPLTDYTEANGITDKAAVTSNQIIQLIKDKLQTSVRTLTGGASQADVNIDYDVIVKDGDNDLAVSYDLSSTASEASKTFKVTLKAKETSKKVTGTTAAFNVVFPKAAA